MSIFHKHYSEEEEESEGETLVELCTKYYINIYYITV